MSPPAVVGVVPLGMSALPLRIPLDTAALCNGRAIACTAAWIGTSRPSFMEIRSKAIPTIASGDSLLWALASVTCPMIFVFLGIATLPWDNKSIAVFASTLSPGFAFLESTDFDSSTGMIVPVGN